MTNKQFLNNFPFNSRIIINYCKTKLFIIFHSSSKQTRRNVKTILFKILSQNRIRSFKNTSRFRFPLRAKKFLRNAGEDSTICSSDDKTRAERRSSLAARYTLEVNQLIGVELPWKIRKLNSLSRLSSARENLFPSSPSLLPLLTANDGNKNTFGQREGGREK